MMTEVKMHSLGLAIDAKENPEKYDWFVQYYGGEPQKVALYDDSGLDERYYLFGMEYGPMLLVTGYNESSAHECWLDWLTPIPMDEVHEAYNSFDKLLEYMQSKGHKNDIKLRRFCSEWQEYFFKVSTHNANYTGAWDNWELDEAYQYQPNATDSGIVHTGHYEWMREIKAKDVFFAAKEQAE